MDNLKSHSSNAPTAKGQPGQQAADGVPAPVARRSEPASVTGTVGRQAGALMPRAIRKYIELRIRGGLTLGLALLAVFVALVALVMLAQRFTG